MASASTALVDSDDETKGELDASMLSILPHLEPEPLADNAYVDEPEGKKKKEPVSLAREEGRSLFPFSRVQKIIKADRVSSARGHQLDMHDSTVLLFRIFQLSPRRRHFSSHWLRRSLSNG